jgi:penicillin-binding protein-related factor A (putative recombinase)
MTISETKFRNYLKKLFTDPYTYIKKVADAKQGFGATNNAGLPDYLVISEGRTLWFEVKTSPTKTTFNLKNISDSQYKEFTKIINAGGKILLGIYVNKELYVIDYKTIQLIRYVGIEKSVTTKQLEEWRIKW